MATALVRSGIRSTHLRSGTSALPATQVSTRSFSSSARHDEATEASKWERITYTGIVACGSLAFYILSKGHPHHYESPPYS